MTPITPAINLVKELELLINISPEMTQADKDNFESAIVDLLKKL